MAAEMIFYYILNLWYIFEYGSWYTFGITKEISGLVI